MHNAKLRTVARYVIPAICSNVCFFLFTIVDAIFVGMGVGTNALGAINLAGPTILMVGAVNMLISIGGVAIYAVRIGQGDVDGANDVFRWTPASSGTLLSMICRKGAANCPTL